MTNHQDIMRTFALDILYQGFNQNESTTHLKENILLENLFNTTNIVLVLLIIKLWCYIFYEILRNSLIRKAFTKLKYYGINYI